MKTILKTLAAFSLVFVPLLTNADTYWNGSGNNIYNTNSAYTGIGTSNPAAKLEVWGPSWDLSTWGYPFSATMAIFSNDTAAQDKGAGLLLGGESGTVTGKWGFAGLTGVRDSPGSSYAGKLNMWTSDSGGTLHNRLVIDTGGRVGISTTTPAAQLDVSSSDLSNIIIESQNTGSFASLQMSGGGEYATPSQIWSGGSTYSLFGGSGSLNLESKGAMTFLTGGYNEQMRIDSSGKIGIGTANPSAKLDVAGDIKTSGNIISDGDICIGTCN